ncbi:MAG: hypothetical protein AB7I38_06220 [Dehalococcoidia bacterium]
MTRQQFLHGNGIRSTLSQDLGFGADAPVFHALLTFKDVADWMYYRTAWPEANAKLRNDTAALIRQPVQNAWAEILTTAITQPGAPPANFVLRMVWTPLPGRGGELGAMMVEWAQKRAALGFRFSVANQILGLDAGSLISNVGFERIEEWEDLRSHGSDDETRQYLAAVSPLLSELPRSELLQTLVPMPSA